MVFHQLDHSSSPTFGIEGFDPFECTNSRIMQQDEQGIISNLNSSAPTAEESRYLTGRPAITLYLSCDYFCFSPYQILGKFQSMFCCLAPLVLPNHACHLTTTTCSVSSQAYRVFRSVPPGCIHSCPRAASAHFDGSGGHSLLLLCSFASFPACSWGHLLSFQTLWHLPSSTEHGQCSLYGAVRFCSRDPQAGTSDSAN